MDINESYLKVHSVAVWSYATTETKTNHNNNKKNIKKHFKFGETRMFSQKNPNVIFVQYIT